MAVRTYQFGDFKLDGESFELCRAGNSLKLERKPTELLLLLVARNGRIVTRSEIAESLWDREVFVDTEHGINTAVRKIRQALRDDSEQPRFVQTIPGRGYRFIAPVVEASPTQAHPSPAVPPAPPSFRPLDASPPPGLPAVAPELTSLEPAPVSLAPVPLAPSPDAPLHARLVPAAFSVGLVLIIAAQVIAVCVTLYARRPNRASGSGIRSLAVLPLDNFSGDAEQDYFADGMTDELITMLAKDSTLRIVSRTSVMQYKGAHRPLPDIARELGVDGILEGSIVRSSDKVRLNIQLIQASTDTHLWAESYDRNAQDLAALSGEAALAIARRLGSAVPHPPAQRYINPEAHDDYLRGRYLWFQFKNEQAGDYFKKATALQPDYALGWAGLADYYGQGVIDSRMDSPTNLPLQDAAARKAVELDDSLPEAHLALAAAIVTGQWDIQQADREIDRAIELNPSFADAYNFRAKLYTALRRDEDAVQAEKKAAELSPFERPYGLGMINYLLRRYDAAIDDARVKLKVTPNDVTLHDVLLECYRRNKDYKQAVHELEQIDILWGKNSRAAEIHRAFAQGGYPAVVRLRLAAVQKKAATGYVAPISLALLYAQLGDRERTLILLEAAYRQHAPPLLWVQTDPAYDFLHADPRYRAIVQGVGLPSE